MLRIRREQIKAMYELRLEDSEKSFVAYFRATIPDDIRRHDDAGLRALIQRGIANAEQYGISGGRALVQFLALSLVVSPEFCKVEAVDRFLRTPSATAEAKMDLLTNLVCERLRKLG
jgi:hypothetical protein